MYLSTSFVSIPCLSCSLPQFPPHKLAVAPVLGPACSQDLNTTPCPIKKRSFLPWLVERSAAATTAISPSIQRSAERGSIACCFWAEQGGNICTLVWAHGDLLHSRGKAMPSLSALMRRDTALCGGGGQEEHVKQTDGYTASPVITGINWVNHRLSSCSPCGRRGSDTDWKSAAPQRQSWPGSLLCWEALLNRVLHLDSVITAL